MPGQKSAQKPNDRASFHELQSAKIGNFQQVGSFFIKYYTFFCQKLPNLPPKPNAWAKVDPENT